MSPADAIAIYQREKAAYIERRGTDRVALMPKREPSKRKAPKPPLGLNNARVHYHADYYQRNKQKMIAAARARQKQEWRDKKRAERATPDGAARPRYRGGDRKPTHCLRGHEYTKENTSIIVNSNTGRKQRVCLVCRKQWGAAWLARKKAASA